MAGFAPYSHGLDIFHRSKLEAAALGKAWRGMERHGETWRGMAIRGDCPTDTQLTHACRRTHTSVRRSWGALLSALTFLSSCHHLCTLDSSGADWRRQPTPARYISASGGLACKATRSSPHLSCLITLGSVGASSGHNHLLLLPFEQP